MRRLLLCLGLVLYLSPALAHKPSDSYLHLKVQDDIIQGQWDIALRDLDYAIGLDANGDGLITWGELRARHAAVAAYALARLQVSADGVLCTHRPVKHLVNNHSDGAYAVLRFTVTCPIPPRTLNLHYALFFDLDPLHRGLMRLEYSDGTHTIVFSPEQPLRHIELATLTPWREFLEFTREGVWHIWIGFDHILFLLSLLLPAVVWREGGHWRAVNGFRPACWAVVKVVTAFTVAHSITLSLAVLGIVGLPSRWVESAIAASVILAALNNLYPIIRAYLWGVAFGFGLIHGLGFANVLQDLGLPRDALLTALVGFNLGVEVGQLAIVGVFLPLAFGIRHSWAYRHLALELGSLAIAAVAMVWLIERSFNLELVIFL